MAVVAQKEFLAGTVVLLRTAEVITIHPNYQHYQVMGVPLSCFFVHRGCQGLDHYVRMRKAGAAVAVTGRL